MQPRSLQVSETERLPFTIEHLDDFDEIGRHHEINAIDTADDIDATDPLDEVDWVYEAKLMATRPTSGSRQFVTMNPR